MSTWKNVDTAAYHTKKHLHSGTFVLNHVRSWPVYAPEWRAQEVSLQGKESDRENLYPWPMVVGRFFCTKVIVFAVK